MVWSISVRIRQSCCKVSSSKSPRTVFVLPTSMTKSIHITYLLLLHLLLRLLILYSPLQEESGNRPHQGRLPYRSQLLPETLPEPSGRSSAIYSTIYL